MYNQLGLGPWLTHFYVKLALAVKSQITKDMPLKLEQLEFQEA
jgi:hypothetical protein